MNLVDQFIGVLVVESPFLKEKNLNLSTFEVADQRDYPTIVSKYTYECIIYAFQLTCTPLTPRFGSDTGREYPPWSIMT